MKEEKNITHNDMRFFQNDLLNDLKKLELQLNGRVSGINQTLLTKISEYDAKFVKVIENVTELVSQMAERKYDHERVEELMKMRNKFSDQIIESQSRISIIDKTLENALFKYDKIILDNLNVPGLIGVGSKFKNCAVFFKFLENEYQINQKFKEEGLLNFKSLSDKIDLRLKKSESDISKILQSVNQICDVKFEKIFQKMEEKALATDNYVAQVRIENSKYATDLINATHELNIEWDKLENIRKEIYAKFDAEVDICKKLVITTDRNFKKQQEEFNVFKQRFSQLADYLKDVKNLGKNYREMTKNIDFSKKQKLEEEFDQEKYDEIGENVKEYIRSPSPRRNRGTMVLKLHNTQKNNDSDENPLAPIVQKRKMNKRASLSPSPRRSTIHMKKKKMTQIETLNQIAEEGSNRLSTVLKNKLKEEKEKNQISNNNVKKNLENFYKTDLKKKKSKELEEDNKNKGKTAIKTLKRKKTIVTENKIDLNFNNENNKDSSKEIIESENSSTSSNFELSSIISLKKIGEEQKEDKIKDKNKKEAKNKNLKLFDETKSDNEKPNLNLNKDKDKNSSSSNEEGKNLKNYLKIDKKREENNDKSESDSGSESESSFKQEPIINKKEKEKIEEKREVEKEKIKSKEKQELNIPEMKNEKPENKKINNNINIKKEKFKTPPKSREKSRENTKRIKEKDLKLNKSQKKVKIQRRNSKLSTKNEKTNTIREDIQKKSNSPILPKRTINLDPIELKHKKKFFNYVQSTYNDSKHDNSKDKPKKERPVAVYNRQMKLAMNEYTNKNSNNLNNPINNKINTEITFPQIKTTPTEAIKKENFINTPKENKKIKNKLILGYNKTKPFTFKGLFTNTNQRLDSNNINNINNNLNKETLIPSIESRESKEKIEAKENSKDNKDKIDVNNNKEKVEIKDEMIQKSKEENEIKTANEINEKEEDKEKKEKDKDKKDDINIKILFNSLYDEIKEIKAITTKNNLNKEKENITNKNAFLTSLSNVHNNNFNYYYNDNINENKSNYITIANPRESKRIDEETIKKINNKIDFINGNIKLVNHKISNLENRYQLILNQLNNIFKTVSSYYHHHKRKSDQHHTFRNKLGSIKEKMDQQKVGDILNEKDFMGKIKEIYNDDYDYIDEYKLKIPNDEYNKTLRKIEPFLIKKFKKV